MKKFYYLIIVTVILGLVLTGCFLSNVGQVPATEQSGISSIVRSGSSPCINFENTGLNEGGSVEGEGTVDSLLNIHLEGKDLILIKKDTANSEYVAYNANNPDKNDTCNGCLNSDYGFGTSNLANRIASGDKIVFTFPNGVTVSYFSIMMFDYGDWYPSGSGDPQIILTDNDGNSVVYDFPSSTSTNYDACSNTGNGIEILEISGSGINEVTLEFLGKTDPGVGFDDICFTPEPKECFTYLQAGNPKDGVNEVGIVMLECIPGNDYLTVTYTTDEPWLMNEIHFHAASNSPDVTWPVTKVGNPIPGHFDYKFEGSQLEEGEGNSRELFSFTIPLDDLDCGDTLYFAAHAAVFKVIGDGCESPQWASEVIGNVQGTLVGGGPVTDLNRTDPEKALGPPDASTTPPAVGFYALGFVSNGDGWIELAFDYPIYNGSGYDIVINEVTWGRGSYPEEVADVYVIANGMEHYAGTVNSKDNNGIGHVSIPVGLVYVDSVKLVDATDPVLFGTRATADGYDLDAVGAYLLYQEESAWGEGPGFYGKNWAMYFRCEDFLPECQ